MSSINQLSSSSSTRVVNLAKLIGAGYKQFWNFTGRYRVLKGGRGSKKSTTASFWFPYKMMEYYEKHGLKPHTLVVRRYYNTHRDSTYAQIKWAINQLGVGHLWKATRSPLELVYKPSGQKIMFRGLDDPQSITSITVEEGYLCWVWWEEAFQVISEEDFNKVDLSIRGEVPAPLFKQHTLVLNPWSEKHWIKKRFFDKVGSNGLSADGDVLAITKNYDVNEFLGDDDRQIFEKMKIDNPRRFKIEGRGEWGIATGLIYNWVEEEFDYERLKRTFDHHGNLKYRQYHGMDFGYTNDPTAFIAILVDEQEKKIYIYDEAGGYHMRNRDIVEALRYKGYIKALIRCDRDIRTIDELRALGLSRARPADKGPNSVKAGIQKIQDYKLIVHPRCVNVVVELNNYVWDTDRETGKPSTEPIGEYNHWMDALRYAAETIGKDNFSW